MLFECSSKYVAGDGKRTPIHQVHMHYKTRRDGSQIGFVVSQFDLFPPASSGLTCVWLMHPFQYFVTFGTLRM